MRVHVVGSSGTFPAPGRPSAGFVISQGDVRVWCDAGFGTFMALPVDSEMIGAIVVSHQHPDHCADLLAAYHAWTYRPLPRDPVPLFAPQAVWDRLVDFVGKEPGCFDFSPVWTGVTADLGELTVEFVGMDHSVPTVGSRWTANNRSLFYTADTGPEGDWRTAAIDVDVLLCEASYQGPSESKDYPHHLTAEEAGVIARDLGARHLVLTHIPPFLDASRSVSEAEGAFDRPVQLAVPGTSFDV